VSTRIGLESAVREAKALVKQREDAFDRAATISGSPMEVPPINGVYVFPGLGESARTLPYQLTPPQESQTPLSTLTSQSPARLISVVQKFVCQADEWSSTVFPILILFIFSRLSRAGPFYFKRFMYSV
jgi:hypothetical protein